MKWAERLIIFCIHILLTHHYTTKNNPCSLPWFPVSSLLNSTTVILILHLCIFIPIFSTTFSDAISNACYNGWLLVLSCDLQSVYIQVCGQHCMRSWTMMASLHQELVSLVMMFLLAKLLLFLSVRMRSVVIGICWLVSKYFSLHCTISQPWYKLAFITSNKIGTFDFFLCVCTAWILQYFLNHCLITDTSSVLESLYSAFHCVDTQNVFKTHLLTFLHLILTMRYCSYFFMLLLFVSWCDIFILSFWV